MHYRSDVDGLRAVAIIPVVLFHIGITTGGFVGVDVFFVISGFLITNLIVEQQKRGTYSILTFYERRIRRIIPALLTVLFAFFAVSIFAFAPLDRINFARTAIYSITSVSNIYFSFTNNYFERGADSQPLLHTWSLGVEEQFYLFFPVLLILLARRKIPAAGVLWLIFAASLAVSAVGALLHWPSAFYMLPSRAWELLTGSLLAIGAVPPIRSGAARNLVGLAGLALIGGSILFITPITPFPGLTALAPCLGAAALIAVGGSGPNGASWLLSRSPMVAIGKISYSLYLWHWPILTFQRMAWTFFPHDSKIGAGIVVIGLSLVASYLTWRFVEQPFRGQRISRRGLAVTLGGGSALLVALCSLVLVTGGLPNVLPGHAGPYGSYINYKSDANSRRGVCLLWKRYKSDLDDDVCLTPATDRPNVLIMGDSHAADLWLGLHEAYPEYHWLQATAAACKPLEVQTEESYDRCDALTRRLYQDFLPTRPVDAVVLMGNWKAFDVEPAARTALALKAQGFQVIWVGPTVQYDSELPRILTLAWLRSDPAIVDRHRRPGPREVDRLMAARARDIGIPYVSVVDILCDEASCTSTLPGGAPVEYDGAHMTGEGSRFVAAAMRTNGVFANLSREPPP